MTADYKDRVLAWMDSKGYRAEGIAEVLPRGTDYAGSTEDGYHSTFEVEIRWIDDGGQIRHLDVDGEEMNSLWRFVIGEIT